MVEESDSTELGFLEDTDSWRLESYLFPSKIGGKPAWLSLENLPTAEDLQCKQCGNIMIFLCQLYAPYVEDADLSDEQLLHNFHRTLFVFICRNEKCCIRNNSENIKVLRSSLNRHNKFYSFDPPAEETPLPDFSLNRWINLCQVCGCMAEKKCSNCKNVHYCSRQHQVLDWKEGHKEECKSQLRNSRKSEILFPEGEIVTEPEELCKIDDTELQKYEKLVENSKHGTMANIAEQDLEAYATQDVDKVFNNFQKRIRSNPEQIIRYKRNGQPLWISKEPLPINIPNCEHCNGPRQFEFQIMPQLLSLLKENTLDWGVIAIYTCRASCTNNNNYKNEFIFKQDVFLSNLPDITY